MAKCQSLFSGGLLHSHGLPMSMFSCCPFYSEEKAAPHEAAFSPQRNPVPSHPLCPMSSVSAWSTAAAVPKYDGARHTWVSRHFCRDRWWSPGFLCYFFSLHWFSTFFRKRWGGKGGTFSAFHHSIESFLMRTWKHMEWFPAKPRAFYVPLLYK